MLRTTLRKSVISASKTNSVVEMSLKTLEKRPNHKMFADYLRDDRVPMVVGVGPAGCGKTLLSCAHAIHKLTSKEINKIIITRPAVTMDENHGYLPGDLESKMAPWLVPIYHCFKTFITTNRLREYMTNEDIEICPLSYIRGRTFDNSWVIADEVQNATTNQMKTLMTRMGQDSKIVLNGDLQQCDLKGVNGLDDFLQRYELYMDDEENAPEMIKVVQFNEEDIMRSELVKHVLDIYNHSSHKNMLS